MATKKKPAKKPKVPEVHRSKATGRILKPAKKKRSTVKKIAPTITRKVVIQKPKDPDSFEVIDTAKAVAFGMDLVRRRKEMIKAQDQQATANSLPENMQKLARRPTTRKQGQQTESFSKEDLDEFRKRLVAARTKATNGVSVMKAMGVNETEDHEADGGDGTAQTLRLQALGQVGNINRTIQKIDEALHRIEDGTYGVCTICGQLIRKPRLLNQPFVLTCMECQSQMERGIIIG